MSRTFACRFFFVWLIFAAAGAGWTDASELELSAGAGYFLPSNRNFRNEFGGGILTGGDIALWSNKRIGAAISAGYYKSKNKPVYNICDPVPCMEPDYVNRRILPVTASFLYRLSPITWPNRIQSYVGTGTGIYLFRQHHRDVYYHNDYYFTKGVLGLHVLAGFRIDLTERVRAIMESRFSGTFGKGIPGEGDDVGGLTVSAKLNCILAGE